MILAVWVMLVAAVSTAIGFSGLLRDGVAMVFGLLSIGFGGVLAAVALTLLDSAVYKRALQRESYWQEDREAL